MSGFNDVTEGTYYKYRSGIIRPLCLLIRYIAIMQFTPLAQKAFGKFHPLGGRDQQTAANQLFNLIKKHEGSPPIPELQVSIHTLLDTFLRSTGLKDSIIACPTEQALLLFALEGGDGFCDAGKLLTQCIAQEFCFKVIDIHIARLDCHGAEVYAPFRDPVNETAEIAQEIAIEEPVDSDEDVPDDDLTSETEEKQNEWREGLKDIPFMKSTTNRKTNTFSSVNIMKYVELTLRCKFLLTNIIDTLPNRESGLALRHQRA